MRNQAQMIKFGKAEKHLGKLLILSKYIFVIYGTDIYETRKHIHVTYKHRGDKISCKFWLEPEIILDEHKKGSFTVKELSEIKNLIFVNYDLLKKM